MSFKSIASYSNEYKPINEISEILSCNVVLYADNTVILHDDTSILQENLNVIVNWCNDNQLTINAKKSQWMRTNVCKGPYPLGDSRPRRSYFNISPVGMIHWNVHV